MGLVDEASEGSSNIIGPGRICCSVNTFVSTIFFWGVSSLFLFILGLVGVFTSEGFLLFFVEDIYISLSVFGGFSFFVVLLGMVGACAKIEIFFICHIFFMGLLLFAQFLGVIFFLLYLNDVGTIGELDVAANGAQLRFENQIESFAINEAEKWVDTQNQFDCCGISFERFLDEDDQELRETVIETGALCEDNRAEIQAAREEIAIFDANGIDGNLFFFCVDKFASVIKDSLPFIGAAIGVVLFLQLAAIISAIRMYWVPIWRGGWMFDEEELEQIAEDKNIAFPVKQEVQNVGPISVFRNMGNRLSFRVQNALTANPNVPQGTGFLKRLSYNGAGSSPGFGMPNPKNRGTAFDAVASNPPTGFQPSSLTISSANGLTYGGPPNRNRLSNRLSAGFQAFGNAFGQIRNNFRHGPPTPPKQPVEPPGYAGIPPTGISAKSTGRHVENSIFQRSFSPHSEQQKHLIHTPAFADLDKPQRINQNSYQAPMPLKVSSNHGGTKKQLENNPSGTYNKKLQVSTNKKKPSNGGTLNMFYSRKKKTKKSSYTNKPSKTTSPVAATNGGLLAQIQRGKGLKPTISNDRSAPRI